LGFQTTFPRLNLYARARITGDLSVVRPCEIHAARVARALVSEETGGAGIPETFGEAHAPGMARGGGQSFARMKTRAPDVMDPYAMPDAYRGARATSTLEVEEAYRLAKAQGNENGERIANLLRHDLIRRAAHQESTINL
jgi:hypothetical protein